MKKNLLLVVLGLSAVVTRLHAVIPTNGWTNGSTFGTFIQSVEAESGTLNGPMVSNSTGTGDWTSGSAPQAGAYVESTTSGSGSVDISFTPPYTGDYKISCIVFDNSTSHHKWKVGFNGGVNDVTGGGNLLWITTTDNTNPQTLWVTDDSSSNQADTSGNARVWRLTAGTTYTVNFAEVQLKACLDQISFYIDPDDLPAPAGLNTGTGVCGAYYNQAAPPASPVSGVPALSRTDATIDFNWGSGSPGTGVGNNNFASKWTGFVEAPYSGVYTFRTVSDDGVNLWVNGVHLVSDWTDHGSTNDDGYITLTAGTKYPLTMDYYQNGGGDEARLQWFCPGEIPSFVAVPQSRLYPCGAGVPTATPVATNTPLAGSSSTRTPTRTATPTPTMVLPPVYQGLTGTARLYGREYIPFPNQVTGANTFYDLSVSFTTNTNTMPKNTARWRIELVNLSSTVGSQVGVETRIGPFGVTCTTGYWDPNALASATALTLPARPQNLSTTYVWLDSSLVPVSEQYDTMGDPRFVPYVDIAGATAGAFVNNYNWFFKNIADTTLADYNVSYVNFLPNAQNGLYNGGPNTDVPKQMRLWREGIALTQSIYTSMTGWSNYYIGAGGELGGDSANKLTSGIIAYNGPWGAGGSSGQNEITGSAVLVRNSTWISSPWIGELWPDASYATDWSNQGGSATWGNLRNNQQSGSAYRTAWNNCNVAGQQTFSNVGHRNAANGCASFMNGGGPFNHSGQDGYVANWLYDSQVMAQDYNFAIPTTFSVARPWGLNIAGNTPQEWNQPPYSTNRFALDMYTASTQTATNIGFFEWTASASQRSSGIVRGLWNGNVGWYVINGLAPSTDSGINFVARFAILSCLRTFHEAGAPGKNTDGVLNGQTIRIVSPPNQIGGVSYRIEPIPYVSITYPTVGADLTGDPNINLTWSKRYVRWDGKRYTENYPCIDDYNGPCTPADPSKVGNPNLEWHSLTGTALVFNVIYSMDGGSTWKSCLTNSIATPGVYMDTVDSIDGTASNFYNYLWNVAGLAPGKKLVRVECFRAGIPEHYAYHEISMVTKP